MHKKNKEFDKKEVILGKNITFYIINFIYFRNIDKKNYQLYYYIFNNRF